MCHSVKRWQAGALGEDPPPDLLTGYHPGQLDYEFIHGGSQIKKGKFKFSKYHELFQRRLGKIKYKKSVDE